MSESHHALESMGLIISCAMYMYRFDCCSTHRCENGRNRQPCHHSALTECLLISSLRFCISSAILLCSSAVLALMRASSSAAAAHIGLSDLEYSLSLVTKLSKSCCFCTLFSSDRFCSSGLYFCVKSERKERGLGGDDMP